MHRYSRTVSATAATLLASILLLTSTGTATADEDDATTEDEPSPELETLSEAEGFEDQAEDTTLALNSLERAPSGETTLLWTVTNHEGDRLHTVHFRVPQYWEYNFINATHGVTLLDEATQTRYYPLTDSDHACLCAGGFIPNSFRGIVDPDQSVSYWNTYLLPDDVTTVTVEAPGYDPFEGIEVTDIS